MTVLSTKGYLSREKCPNGLSRFLRKICLKTIIFYDYNLILSNILLCYSSFKSLLKVLPNSHKKHLTY